MLPGSPTSFQVRLDTIADVLTAIAYFALPVQLIFFLHNYHAHIPKKYHPLVLMFALFIVLCGCTHVANAYHAGITAMLVAKLSTAFISLITAAAMLVVIPGFITLLQYTKGLEEKLRGRMVGRPISDDWKTALNFAVNAQPKKSEELTSPTRIAEMEGDWKKMETSSSTS